METQRPAGPPPLALAVGDVARLRRAHPCGGFDWRVVRVGADIGVTCMTCGRRLLLERRDLERRIVTVVPAAHDSGQSAR